MTQAIIDTKAFVGHPKNQSNPKTREFRLGVHEGTVVFDPSAIEKQSAHAKEIFQEAKKQKKEILVICEKELFKDQIAALADKAGIHYLNHKVPAGVLTNFDTLLLRIRNLQDMRSFVGSETFKTLTKKEQSMKTRELKKVEEVYKGVVNLRRKPELVIIVDGQLMHKFVEEVETLKLNSIILVSSNYDKWAAKNIVPCNVNSVSGLSYILEQILQ
jgi:small subunit ribosomal protein S2